MQYESPHRITISGLFVTPMDMCKVNNETGIFMLGDTLSELGIYRAGVGLPRSFFDLFRREGEYILHD